MDIEPQFPEGSNDPAPSTRALSHRARAGSRQDAEALYVHTLPALVAWFRIHHAAGTMARVEAEEFTQEVWLRVLAGFDTFDPGSGSFRAWMFGVAKRVGLEASNPRRRRWAPLPTGKDTALGLQSDSITPVVGALVREESLRALVDFVSALDEIDRGVLVHHGLEALSCADTARRLDMTSDAVSKRWQRLQARMRDSAVGRELVFEG